jgi:hypothetical protein
MKKAFLPFMLSVILISILLPSALPVRVAAALPAGPYLQPNQKATISGWEIQVSNGIKWAKEIKSDDMKNQDGTAILRKSQDGMTFALVPVTIKNISDRTSSLLVGVWNFYDYTGRSYLLFTLGIDFLPTTDRLNLKEFKPGESRKGYLPFELLDGLDKKDKYMQLIIPLVGSASWKL